MKVHKIAILTSHPIQYQAPLFQRLAKCNEIDLMVYFYWDFGVGKESFDPEFKKMIQWDEPLLDGYKYRILRNYSLKPSNSLCGSINFGIIKELKRNKYDLLFVHGWNSFTNLLAIFSAFLFGTPVAMHGDNCFSCEKFKPSFKRTIKKIILHLLFKRINFFLYMGIEDKKFYEYHGVPEEKLIFMPYATDNDKFFDMAKTNNRLELRKKFGINDRTVILFSGKLINRKRPFDLLKAYEKLSARENILLVFAGDGELRSELEEYTKLKKINDVWFIGFKNLTELPNYYNIADIFVIPSFNECWGIVVNEAMCFGLPVIASDSVGSAPDLIKDGENGYIYPTGDIKKLAEYIETLIINPEKRFSFSKKSLDIIKNYSYQKDIEGMIEALKRLS